MHVHSGGLAACVAMWHAPRTVGAVSLMETIVERISPQRTDEASAAPSSREGAGEVESARGAGEGEPSGDTPEVREAQSLPETLEEPMSPAVSAPEVTRTAGGGEPGAGAYPEEPLAVVRRAASTKRREGMGSGEALQRLAAELDARRAKLGAERGAAALPESLEGVAPDPVEAGADAERGGEAGEPGESRRGQGVLRAFSAEPGALRQALEADVLAPLEMALVAAHGCVLAEEVELAPGWALERGTILGAAQVALLAESGQVSVAVHPQPRVHVIALGEQAAGASYGVAAAVEEAGALPTRSLVGLDVAGDHRMLTEVLEDAAGRADVLVVCGVGLGEDEVAIETIQQVCPGLRGDEVELRVRPSEQGQRREHVEHTVIGNDRVLGAQLFTLPARAASALAGCELVIRPALKQAAGVQPVSRPSVRASTSRVLRAGAHAVCLPVLLEVKKGAYVATPVRAHSALEGLANANGLAHIPASTEIAAGSPVRVSLLPQRSR